MNERAEVSGGLTLLRALLIVLSVVYLLQIYSPLRLNTDAMTYLSMTESFVDTRDLAAIQGQLSPGYPLMLALLEFMGLGVSWAFAALNYVFLGVGLTASYFLLRREFTLSSRAATLVCCLFLLSFVTVKHAVLPMAELASFGTLLASLWILSTARRSNSPARWRLYVAAGVLIVVCIAIRPIGIALLPAFLWQVWREYGYGERPLKSALGSLRAVPVVLLTLGMLTTGILLLMQPMYLDEISTLYSKYGLRNNLSYMFSARLREWSELLLNVPRSQAPQSLRMIYPFVGIGALLLIFYGLYLRRFRWGTGEIFVFFYFVILVIYPGQSTRYWLPVLPLLMGYVATVAVSLSRFRVARGAVACYVATFALAGTAALTYSTMITFSGADFPDRYGDGTLSSTYHVAFEGRQNPDEFEEDGVKKRALRLLLRYEPRARAGR